VIVRKRGVPESVYYLPPVKFSVFSQTFQHASQMCRVLSPIWPFCQPTKMSKRRKEILSWLNLRKVNLDTGDIRLDEVVLY